MPANPDGGADNPVELGMKFRSDQSGMITGLRFYKTATNTGTHVGNLWSSTGTLLGSGTFINETTSGWQQVLFTTPVPITANTVYVASYHANNGHYSADTGFFGTAGVDNAPLHALAEGVSGSNGVYAYGSGSVFPTQTWNSANYWVDVVFEVGNAAIFTTSLPDGYLTVAYSSPLAGGGGTTPYAWSLASGALPTGLTLNASTGVISGTPTAAGTFSFSVKLTDSSNPVQTATKAFTITTSTPPSFVSIWPASTVPGVLDDGADNPVQLGLKFRSDVSGAVSGVRFYKAAGNTGTHVGSLWSSTGTLLASVTFNGETASGWQQMNFSTPVQITPNTTYVVSYHTTVGHYSVGLNYFASAGFDNGSLHALSTVAGGGNGVYAYGAATSFPNQTYQGANYWVDVAFQAGPAPVLQSIAVTPAAPGVLTGATQQFTATGTYSVGSPQDITNQVTWASSAPSFATINATGLATGVTPGSTNITATLGSVSGGTTLAVTTAPLAITTTTLPAGNLSTAYTSTTLQRTGGVPNYTWSIANGALPNGLTLAPATGIISGTPTVAGTFNFTVGLSDGSAPVQSVTKALSIVISSTPPNLNIWAQSTTPATIDGGADSAVQVGVKFRSDVAGTISGIRFYKASTNTGTHVGNLWSSTGTRLGFATFINETASGWQEVVFGTPVAIAANTTYVASYSCTTGHYSLTQSYFATTGVDAPPLHVLSNAAAGGNGVYGYGSATTFPTLSWNATNYWVDVVFQQGTGTDTIAPTITDVTPAVGIVGADLASTVTATFSETMNASTISGSTFFVRNPAGQTVAATVTYNSTTKVVTLVPTSPLAAYTAYTVTAKGGSSGMKDSAGNALAADVAWTFTTNSFGAAVGGPGGPILIISDASNPFSRYYAEILLAEGMNNFALKDTSAITASGLAPYDLVILGDFAITTDQVTALTNWVNGGGNLIAMRPDKKLAGLLGLTDAVATLSNQYLAATPIAGVVSDTIQFHGTADLYNLGATAAPVAMLYSSVQTATSNPAVTLRSVGSLGGQAAAFTYDLARSVALTRQGNPAWVGQERDGQAPQRSDDLFFGAASFDPQPDWINLDKVAIPQADEQQRLLANLMIFMAGDRKLLPRFWYFPDDYKAAIVMTGDDHANGGTTGRFTQYQALSDPDGSLNDWELIRSTSYVFPAGNPMTNAQAVAFTAAGFEVAMHLDPNGGNYTPAGLEALFSSQLSQYASIYPGLPAPTTHRAHLLAWTGYTVLPEVEAAHGIRMDTTYYYWPGTWILNRPGMFTGSGMPMRFAKTTGEVVDVYQTVTQMTDESALNQTYPFTVDQMLDKALGPEGYYGAFCANMHTDAATTTQSDAIVASAIGRGIPVISAKQLLTWTDARNASSFSNLVWSNNKLTFTITANPAANGLQTMVPIPASNSVVSTKRGGVSIAYQVKMVKGLPYVVFAAVSGSYEVTFVLDATPPTVSAVSPTNAQTEVPSSSQVNVTFSEALTSSSVTSSTVVLRDSSNNIVPANVSYASNGNIVTLAPVGLLTPKTTYTLRVISGTNGVKDFVGNAMAADFVSTFTVSATPATLSLWDDSATPATLASTDTNSVEVGLKFQSTVAGKITGIRFYKGATNTGVHSGNLWSSTGTLLGTTQFTNETTSGWQTQMFTTPVNIAANTTYVVSYFASSGGYSLTGSYFASAGFTNGPLRALSTTEGSGNGVYRYTSSSGFPTQSFNGSNYWVDVIFQQN